MSWWYRQTYESPNIIIVPTVSFSSPTTPTGEKNADHTEKNRASCDQIIVKGISESSPSASHYNQEISQNVITNLSSQAVQNNIPESPRNINATCNSIDTQTNIPKNINQGIKDLTSSKYKSRNSLVDLTGFNILKRDSASSINKHKEFVQIDSTEIEKEEMKTVNEKYQISSGTNTGTKDNMSNKNEMRQVRNSENHTINETKENTFDMEDKMKKYFRLLWKHSMQKLKDRSTKEVSKIEPIPNTNTRHDSKDSKSDQNKVNQQKVSKNNSEIDSRDKTTVASSKRDNFGRKIIREYFNRSKSETKVSVHANSKGTLGGRKVSLSPVDFKRYKDFQQFISHSDDRKTKYKSVSHNKLPSMANYKIPLKSNKTTTNNLAIKKQIDQSKQATSQNKLITHSEETVKKNTNKTRDKSEIKLNKAKRRNSPEMCKIKQNPVKGKTEVNTEKTKLMKSAVRVKNNISVDNSQNKHASELPDLRSMLSRKRKSDYFTHSQPPVKKTLERENLVITVANNSKSHTTTSATLPHAIPNATKPMNKKCKKIKLIINIECPNTDDSDDSGQNVNESQDLSFLDDFNVDEIVDSLNTSQESQIEHNITIKHDHIKSKITDKLNEKDNANTSNLQMTLNEGLINHFTKGDIEVNKEQVIVINSEDEDLKPEMGSDNIQSQRAQIVKPNSTVDSNITKAIKTTNLTEEAYEDNSRDEHSLLAQTVSHSEPSSSMSNIDCIFDLLPATSGQSGKKQALKRPNKKTYATKVKKSKVISNKHKEITQKSLASRSTSEMMSKIVSEYISDCTRQIPFRKADDPIEASLKTIFNIEQKNTGAKEKRPDPVEASLETMFNTIQQTSNQKQIDPSNKFDKMPEEKNYYLQETSDAEASMETIFNQKVAINANTNKPNFPNKYVKNEVELLRKAKELIEMPLESLNYGGIQEEDTNKVETVIPEEVTAQIKIETGNSEDIMNEILPNVAEASINEQGNMKINAEHVSLINTSITLDLIKEKCSELCKRLTQKSLNAKLNMAKGKKINKSEKKPVVLSGNNEKGATENLRIIHDQSINDGEDKIVNKIPLEGSTQQQKRFKTPETEKKCFEQAVSKRDEQTIVAETNNNIKLETNINTEINNSDEDSQFNTLSEVTSINSLECNNNSTEYKSNNITKVELLDHVDENTTKTLEEAVRTIENSLVTNNKETEIERNHVKSTEIAKNNIEKQNTDEDLDKAKGPDLKVITSDGILNMKAETLTKNKEQPVDSNKNLVSNAKEGTSSNEQKPEVKSASTLVTDSKNKTSHKLFITEVEARIFNTLKEEYKIREQICKGRFSTFYKCENIQGEACAVKVFNVPYNAKLVAKLLSNLQKHRSRMDSRVLFLYDSFEIQGRWCLLTEYYPRNLEQVMLENVRSFHIDQVQVLSAQLVGAVNMLTNYNIIHSDIKPTHILLNDAQNRLKLTGFDRSNYRNYMHIKPSTGTPGYRAPEVILGFLEDHKIDVWSTAVVIFEMATNKRLFPGQYNNEILYQQLCLLGSIDWTMVDQSRFRHAYFLGTSFLREIPNQQIVLVHVLHRSKTLRKQLFSTYNAQWAGNRTRWQTTEDVDKLKKLNSLLEQMLVLDPRQRLPIQFVGASEFLYETIV